VGIIFCICIRYIIGGFVDEIKNCPFCGSNKIKVYTEYACGWFIECDNNEGSCFSGCHATTGIEHGSKEEAIKEWNKRK